MNIWVCDSGQKVEIFIPFLGKCRPPLWRCCQTCTLRSWDDFYREDLGSLGFRNAIRVTEEDTRYRGWLVRRVCGLIAVWGWKIPADVPKDLAARICRSKRVRDVTSSWSLVPRGDNESHQGWKEKVLEILAEIQSPLSFLTLRLCNWLLLKLLSRLFLNVQLHRGQLEMVLRASRMSDTPLVFLSTQKSQLDGLLLTFLLLSQGLGAPRVAGGAQLAGPRLRALLRRLGGIFLPSGMKRSQRDQDKALSGAVVAAYVEEVLRSHQPLLIFLEEPLAARHLSAPARQWLAMVHGAVRDGSVPDVLLVPVGIAYDVVPGGFPGEDAVSARWPLSLWAACRALCRNLGCARVDFGQPFSLQEFAARTLAQPSRTEESLEELLLPTILGTCSRQPGGSSAPIPSGGTEREKEEMLVTRLGLHSLHDSVACSAVMAVGITAALLLHKHQEGVFFSWLMADFAWLLEEILLHQRDVGFSGQLRVLVQHSLILLKARVTLYHLSPVGDALVVPEGSVEALRELGYHSAAILPVFGSEAVGACAIHASLTEMLPFVGAPAGAASVVLSQGELQQKILELLRLLPTTLLGLQPCQPLELQSQDILDKLLLCGLLEPEEPESSKRWVCDLAPSHFGRRRLGGTMDFSDSDSEDRAPKRCFKLSEPQGSPGFFRFLCQLLRPTLSTYVRAVAFLERPSWPQPEDAYVEALLEFLAEGDGFVHPTRSLALSSLQTFKELGVLEELPSSKGSLLHLSELFLSAASREKLAAFIQRFTD
ncbi:glycerol-3-phosphate acyltransferase 2, mitochondrial-like [Phaenicophaeus curvirostris]|uniref:glycerol-3-phosphate acyltransferase 2, mitochondrial-like n=1 Tax=Phaenicophaeus curvirostris TaxID=33595 RepID=UPI0037F0F3B9